MRQVKGAIHVHTEHSDGSGSVEEIIRAAQAADLDFIVLTDHDSLEAAENGNSGRHGDLLVVVGAEVSPARRGHCLALGSDDVTGYKWMPERFFIHKLRREGADTYIAHPEGRVKRAFGINLSQWHTWQEEPFTGIEIWSYMHDWVDNVSYATLPRYYLRPHEAIDGPDRKVLALWDRLNMRRRVVGIGALDAHAVEMFFGLLVAFEYEFLFRTVLTHVLVAEWGDDAEEDTRRLRKGLRLGRAFISYQVAGEAEGFDFRSSDGAVMGAREEFHEGTLLEVEAPEEGRMTLVHNGRRCAEAEGREAQFEAWGPGVYRVEMSRNGTPWIFSNPIVLGRDGR